MGKIGGHVSILRIIESPLTYTKQAVGTNRPNPNAWGAIVQPDSTMHLKAGAVDLGMSLTWVWTTKLVLAPRVSKKTKKRKQHEWDDLSHLHYPDNISLIFHIDFHFIGEVASGQGVSSEVPGKRSLVSHNTYINSG